MFLPVDLQWLEIAIVGAVIVFFVDLIGNMISFNNRFVNALTTALVFLALFGTFNYIQYREGNLPTVPSISDTAP